ncbi:MAG TPA: PASTA domain-containing protein [Candidatus Tenderia sp.]|nr:PASTA domain-containing protein [Candidatus Tenderia sp.]
MSTDTDLVKRLAKLEKETAKARKRFTVLEQDSARKDRIIADLNRMVAVPPSATENEEVRILKAQMAELASEKAALLATVDTLKADRIKPTPTQLLGSFRNAMDELRRGLTPAPGDRVAYTVSQFDIDLKAQVAVDQESESVRFILPEPGQDLPADSLSQIRFTFQTVPRPEAEDEEPFIVVPTLLQLSRKTAHLALEQAGLSLGSETYRASNAIPGTVIAQVPDPGDEIPASEAVDIVIAKSPTVAMPKVVGLLIEDAKALLSANELDIGSVTEKPSDAVAAGTVVQQSIAEAQDVLIGTAIDLVVASNPKINVPNLVGMTLAQAKQTLKDQGLTLGEYSTRQSPPEQDGLILSQTPEAETAVLPDTAISITIGSVGKRRVPDVRRRNLKHASELLADHGFRVGKITKKFRQGGAIGIVLSQNPPARKLEETGTPVDLVLTTRDRKEEG